MKRTNTNTLRETVSKYPKTHQKQILTSPFPRTRTSQKYSNFPTLIFLNATTQTQSESLRLRSPDWNSVEPPSLLLKLHDHSKSNPPVDSKNPLCWVLKFYISFFNVWLLQSSTPSTSELQSFCFAVFELPLVLAPWRMPFNIERRHFHLSSRPVPVHGAWVN